MKKKLSSNKKIMKFPSKFKNNCKDNFKKLLDLKKVQKLTKDIKLTGNFS